MASRKALFNNAGTITELNTAGDTLALPAAATGGAQVNLNTGGSAPTSPVDGDMWSTTSGLFYRHGTTTVGPLVDSTGASGVSSFNTRTGAVTLTTGDVTTALGYTPYSVLGGVIDATSGSTTVTINSTSGAAQLNVISNAATGINFTRYQTSAGQPNFVFVKGRGTIASPLPVVQNDRLGAFVFEGNVGTGSATLEIGAEMLVNMIDPSPSSTALGSQLDFQLAPVGSVTLGSIFTWDWSAGLVAKTKIVAPASTTSVPSLNVPHGAAPTSPTNGDMWTTTAGVFARVNGATTSVVGTHSGSSSGTNTGDQTITLTGDVTGTGTGSFSTAIATGAVTSGKLAAGVAVANLGFTPANVAGDTFTGKLVTKATTTSAAGFNLPQGTAPTSPVNGDLWATASGLFVQIAGSTVGPLGTGGGGGAVTSFNTRTGAITLTSGDVTTALTFTPLDASITSTQDAYVDDVHLWNATSGFYAKLNNVGTTDTASRFLNFTLNDANRTLSLAGNLTVSAAATVSGTNTGDQTITLTGDVTGTGTGSFTTTVAAGAITSGKLAAGVAVANLGYTPLDASTTSTQVVSSGETRLWNATSGFAIRLMNSGTGDTASRILNLNLNDAARTVSLSGNLTVSGAATISGTHSGTASGTNTGDQTITLTGVVTGSGTGSFATTITAASVTATMLASGVAISNLGFTPLDASTTSTQDAYLTGARFFNATSTFYARIINIDTTAAALRTLSLNLNNGNRTLSLAGSLTVSGNATVPAGTALVAANNLSDVSNAATALTNLGAANGATTNITISSSAPSGGANGDLWFQF